MDYAGRWVQSVAGDTLCTLVRALFCADPNWNKMRKVLKL